MPTSNSKVLSRRSACASIASGLALTMLGGCINASALISKMVIGDPKAIGKLKATAGIDLEEQEHRVILTCHAPLSISDDFESVADDLEEELLRRMRQKEIPVVDSSEIVDLLDARGGRYDTQLLIDELRDANLLFEMRIENFSIHEPHTPQMFHGKCSGQIVGFQIEGGEDAGEMKSDDKKPTGSKSSDAAQDEGQLVVPRRMARFFEHEFEVDYPNGHPVPRDQMSATIFRKKFVAFLGQRLGNVFFDVTSQELYS